MICFPLIVWIFNLKWKTAFDVKERTISSISSVNCGKIKHQRDGKKKCQEAFLYYAFYLFSFFVNVEKERENMIGTVTGKQ